MLIILVNVMYNLASAVYTGQTLYGSVYVLSIRKNIILFLLRHFQHRVHTHTHTHTAEAKHHNVHCTTLLLVTLFSNTFSCLLLDLFSCTKLVHIRVVLTKPVTLVFLLYTLQCLFSHNTHKYTWVYTQ